MRKFLAQLKDGILKQNPTFVQFLGMCPTLAVTTSAINGVGMGLATTAVLICSNILISLLRKFIPKEIRIASYIVIISGFVTAVELLLHAYVQSLYDSLGLYIPLIVVNCIILARAEAYASKNPVLPSAIDGLAMGLGFTLSLTVTGSVRELIGAGSVFGISVFGAAYDPAIIFILPAGAFLTLAMLAALVNFIRNYAEAHPRKPLSKIEETVIADSEVYEETETEIPQNHATTDIPRVEFQSAVKEMQEKEQKEAETLVFNAAKADGQAAAPITVEIPAEAPVEVVAEEIIEEDIIVTAAVATEGKEVADHE